MSTAQTVGDKPVGYRTPDGKALHVECSKRPEYAAVGLRPVMLLSDFYDAELVDGDWHGSYESCQWCTWGMEEEGEP